MNMKLIIEAAVRGIVIGLLVGVVIGLSSGCGTIPPKPGPISYSKCTDPNSEGEWTCEQCYFDRTLNKLKTTCPKDNDALKDALDRRNDLMDRRK